MVTRRMVRRQRRGFSGGRFRSCLRRCYPIVKSCLGLDTAKRRERYVTDIMECPALSGYPKTLAGEGGEGRVVAPIQGQKPASLARGSAGNATAFDDGRSHATQREIIRHCSTNHPGTTNYHARFFRMRHMPLLGLPGG